MLKALVSTLLGAYAKVKVYGSENLQNTPVLYISNHLSNVDALILERALSKNRPLFMAGVKLKTAVMTRLIMDLVDTVMIEPNTPDLDALKKAIEALRSGKSVLIFPEGGRSRSGSLLRAKPGASVIARKAGVKLQPVSLMGTEKLLPIRDDDMGGERLFKAVVTVKIGEPFSVDEVSVRTEDGKEDRQLSADAMMLRVAALLDPGYRGVYRDALLEPDSR